MVIKYTNIFYSKTDPDWDFLFENKPSGNPGPTVVTGILVKKEGMGAIQGHPRCLEFHLVIFLFPRA
jgi:hypothetical protein